MGRGGRPANPRRRSPCRTAVARLDACGLNTTFVCDLQAWSGRRPYVRRRTVPGAHASAVSHAVVFRRRSARASHPNVAPVLRTRGSQRGNARKTQMCPTHVKRQYCVYDIWNTYSPLPRLDAGWCVLRRHGALPHIAPHSLAPDARDSWFGAVAALAQGPGTIIRCADRRASAVNPP